MKKQKLFIIIVALIICAPIFVLLSNMGRTSGIIDNIEKYEVNQRYYIAIYHVEIEITQEQYLAIQSEEGKWYSFEYMFNNLTNKGRLTKLAEIPPL